MRLMSFALTTEQIRTQTKTVTRRLGWRKAKAGDVVQPVVKGQGLKKGETVERIGYPIRFVSVTRVRLCDISTVDVYREGFPNLTQRQFIEMFKAHNGGLRDQEVTRIEFEYLERPQVEL